jgi:DNA-binding beta-propeller fold protein YncE
MRLAVPLALSFLAAAPLVAGAAELKIVDTIKGPDGGWDYASIDTAGNRLLVARPDGLMAIDLATNAVTPTLVPGKRTHGAVITPNGVGVVASGAAGSAVLFKGSDGSVLAEIPTGGKKPDAVVYEPKTGLVAVMDNKDGGVTLIDVEKKASAGTVEVPGALEFAVADGEGKIFVNVEDKNDLAVLDVANRKVVARRPLPGCDEPSGLALDPESHVLVSACGNGKAIATSATDGKVLATLAIGSHPDAVIFDARNKRFLVPCGGNGVLTVITEEGPSLKVTASIPTAVGARLGAVDEKTGKVYLPTADFQPPAKPGDRPTALPGTFRVLVLAGQN